MEWRSIATQGGTALKPLAIVSLHASPVAALGAGENGGMNVYVRAVGEELSRRGIATEVFTRRSNAQGPDRIRLAERAWGTRLAGGPAREVGKARPFARLPGSTARRETGLAWSPPAWISRCSPSGRPRRFASAWLWATPAWSSSPGASSDSRGPKRSSGRWHTWSAIGPNPNRPSCW